MKLHIGMKSSLLLSIIILSLFLSTTKIPTVYSQPYEDFTTYTESDAGTFINTTATEVDFESWRDETSHLYKDKGANYFKNFTHLLTVECGWWSNQALAVVWLLGNEVNSSENLRNVGETYLSIDIKVQAGAPDVNRLRLGWWNGTIFNVDEYNWLLTYVPYYLTIDRSYANFTCVIRTVSHSGPITDTIFLNTTIDPYQYIYGCNSHNNTNHFRFDVLISNLQIGIWSFTETWSGTVVGMVDYLARFTMGFLLGGIAITAFSPIVGVVGIKARKKEAVVMAIPMFFIGIAFLYVATYV